MICASFFILKKGDKMKKIFKNILTVAVMLIATFIIIMVISTLDQHGRGVVKIGSNANETGTSVYADTIHDGEIMLINNVWGITDKEKNTNTLKSYVYVKPNGNFGWEWSRPDPKSSPSINVPPIYPEVVVGSTVGSSDSTTKLFPIRYGDIDSWTSDVEFQYPKVPTGQHNLAYDIYLVNSSNNVKFNFMIWITGHIDDAEYVKDISDGTNTYGYYRRNPDAGLNYGWHAFILNKQGGTTFKVDIKKLLDQIPDRVSGNWIVQGIELGNEIYDGTGRIEINKYVTTLNGQEVDSSNQGSNMTGNS